MCSTLNTLSSAQGYTDCLQKTLLGSTKPGKFSEKGSSPKQAQFFHMCRLTACISPSPFLKRSYAIHSCCHPACFWADPHLEQSQSRVRSGRCRPRVFHTSPAGITPAIAQAKTGRQHSATCMGHPPSWKLRRRPEKIDDANHDRLKIRTGIGKRHPSKTVAGHRRCRRWLPDTTRHWRGRYSHGRGNRLACHDSKPSAFGRSATEEYGRLPGIGGAC